MNLSKKIRVGDIVTLNELIAWQSRKDPDKRYGLKEIYGLLSEDIKVKHHRDKIYLTISP